MSRKTGTDRRTFFRHALGVGILAPHFVKNLVSSPAASRLGVASCGADGMTFSTLDGICTHPAAKLVAVAEVDSSRLERVKRRYPETIVYTDWRRMLERERKNLDAVCKGIVNTERDI